MDLNEVIKNINHPNPEIKEQLIKEIKTYFLCVDLDKDQKIKKFLKRLSKINNLEARKIIKFAEKIKDGPETRFDQQLLELMFQTGLYKKEFYEVKEFYKKVKPVIFDHYQLKPNQALNQVIDMCAGNGLNAFYWILQEAAKKSVLIDIKENSNYQTLEKALLKADKPIQDRYAYTTQGIENYQEEIEEPAIITSIHGCGELTDKIIEKGLQQKIPFAVMPCCYDYHKNNLFDQKILRYIECKKAFIDGARVYHIQEAGFEVVIKEIDQNITNMNLIIIGLPKTSKN